MKLKLVVLSMSILGLVSCPTYAAMNAKQKKQQKMQPQTETREYKDMSDVCTVSRTSMTLDAMTQNMGRAMPNPCNPGWFNRIQFSGGVNVDFGKFGSRNANIMGENYQVVSLNDAYLNVAATVNDWTKAFASLSYSNPTTNANPATFNQFGAAEYSAAYANNIFGRAVNTLQLEQAFATFGNFDVYPVFVQVGRQYQDFGRYVTHPIERSVTQSKTETLATSAKVGFIVPMGFNGSIYVFNDPLRKASALNTSTNGGVSLGYDQPSDQLGWDIGAAYLYNFVGVNDIAYSVVNFTGTNNYNKRIGGYAIYADVNSGPFMLGARYAASAGRFSPVDLPKNGVADLTGGTIAGSTPSGATGARPWGVGVQAAYSFEGYSKNQKVYVGYQGTSEAAGLNLPDNRWLIGYGIDVWKNTNLAAEWDYDKAYGTSNGGSGRNTNLVSLRLATQYS